MDLSKAIELVSGLKTKLEMLSANDGSLLDSMEQDEVDGIMDSLEETMGDIDLELLGELDGYVSLTDKSDQDDDNNSDAVDLEICPSCDEEDILIEMVEVDGQDTISIRAYCPDCSTHFEMHATLTNLTSEEV